MFIYKSYSKSDLLPNQTGQFVNNLHFEVNVSCVTGEHPPQVGVGNKGQVDQGVQVHLQPTCVHIDKLFQCVG